MNASYATVILFEMAHLWARVQHLPAVEVEGSSEKVRFDFMAKEYPAMAQAAKLLQAAGFDYVNGLGCTTGFDALPGDLQTAADTLAKLLRLSAPGIVANGAGDFDADPARYDAEAALMKPHGDPLHG